MDNRQNNLVPLVRKSWLKTTILTSIASATPFTPQPGTTLLEIQVEGGSFYMNVEDQTVSIANDGFQIKVSDAERIRHYEIESKSPTMSVIASAAGTVVTIIEYNAL